MIRHLARRAQRLVRAVLFRASVPPVRRWLRGRWEGPEDTPPAGLVRFGDLRRLEPIGWARGTDHGDAIDQYYIHGFVERHGSDIRGRVLAMANDPLAERLRGGRVSRIDRIAYRVLDHPGTTFLGELAGAPDLPSDAFDCVILTQAMQLIFDVRGAVSTLHRILRPGGVVLMTVPGIAPAHDPELETPTTPWCWSFTALSARRLFEERFDPDAIEVETFGNVLVAASFLHGLDRSELTAEELGYRDPDYEMLIAVRAQKARGAA